MIRQTIFSEDRKYRYTLWRDWSEITPALVHPNDFVQFIGLNPSTADETLDDPTIRRCKSFAQAWGYGAMCMTNIFAWRDTDPKNMLKATEPIGPDNDKWIFKISGKAGIVVAAWGKHGKHMWRANAVKTMFAPGFVKCLRKNKDGSPEHPLYLPKTLTPIPL